MEPLARIGDVRDGAGHGDEGDRRGPRGGRFDGVGEWPTVRDVAPRRRFRRRWSPRLASVPGLQRRSARTAALEVGISASSVGRIWHEHGLERTFKAVERSAARGAVLGCHGAVSRSAGEVHRAALRRERRGSKVNCPPMPATRRVETLNLRFGLSNRRQRAEGCLQEEMLATDLDCVAPKRLTDAKVQDPGAGPHGTTR